MQAKLLQEYSEDREYPNPFSSKGQDTPPTDENNRIILYYDE